MAAIKFPLSVQLDSRDFSTEKDSLITNCFLEPAIDESVNVVKRPGLDLNIQASGVGLGVYRYGNLVYQFYNQYYDAPIRSLEYANSKFVGATRIKQDSDTGLYKVTSLTSTDGNKWLVNHTPVTLDTGSGVYPFESVRLSVANGVFYLVPVTTGALFRNIFRSTDGVTWTKIILSANSERMSNVVYGNGTYLAIGVGTGGAGVFNYFRSSDGISWTNTVTYGGSSQSDMGLVFNGTVFIQSSSGVTRTSTDTLTWNTYSSGLSGETTLGIATNPSGTVVLTTTQNRAYSTDNGVTFNAIPNTTGYTDHAVKYIGTNFVYLREDGITKYSSDGISWTDGPTIPTVSDNWTTISGTTTRWIASNYFPQTGAWFAISDSLGPWTVSIPTQDTNILIT